MVDYSKVSDNPEIIKLIKQMVAIEAKIVELDNMALIRYQLEVIKE